MENIDSAEDLKQQLETHQQELQKYKRGLRKGIPLFLGLALLFPIIPLPSRHRDGVHAMTEKISYPICVAILAPIMIGSLLYSNYKKRKELTEKIISLQQEINKTQKYSE